MIQVIQQIDAIGNFKAQPSKQDFSPSGCIGNWGGDDKGGSGRDVNG